RVLGRERLADLGGEVRDRRVLAAHHGRRAPAGAGVLVEERKEDVLLDRGVPLEPRAIVRERGASFHEVARARVALDIVEERVEALVLAGEGVAQASLE